MSEEEIVMRRDLGTYYVKVELAPPYSGFIFKWETCNRFNQSNNGISPLNAGILPADYFDEKDVIDSIIYNFVMGNYSCDCNLKRFIANSNREHREHISDFDCGSDCQVIKLTLVRPDLSTEIIFNEQIL